MERKKFLFKISGLLAAAALTLAFTVALASEAPALAAGEEEVTADHSAESSVFADYIIPEIDYSELVTNDTEESFKARNAEEQFEFYTVGRSNWKDIYDIEASMRLYGFLDAAQKGSVPAMLVLAENYAKPQYSGKYLSTCWYWCMQAIEHGDASGEALYYAGYCCLLSGDELYEQAKDYLNQSAADGFPLAEKLLTAGKAMHEAKDDREWTLSYLDALYCIEGPISDPADLHPEDTEEAFLARSGEEQCNFVIARYSNAPEGCTYIFSDTDKNYMIDAANKGCARAMQYLAANAGWEWNRPDPSPCWYWARKALDAEKPDGCFARTWYALGGCSYIGGSRAYPLAAEFFEKAYKNGEPAAAFYLGLIAAETEDFACAEDWAKKYDNAGLKELLGLDEGAASFSIDAKLPKNTVQNYAGLWECGDMALHLYSNGLVIVQNRSHAGELQGLWNEEDGKIVLHLRSLSFEIAMALNMSWEQQSSMLPDGTVSFRAENGSLIFELCTCPTPDGEEFTADGIFNGVYTRTTPAQDDGFSGLYGMFYGFGDFVKIVNRDGQYTADLLHIRGIEDNNAKATFSADDQCLNISYSTNGDYRLQKLSDYIYTHCAAEKEAGVGYYFSRVASYW